MIKSFKKLFSDKLSKILMGSFDCVACGKIKQYFSLITVSTIFSQLFSAVPMEVLYDTTTKKSINYAGKFSPNKVYIPKYYMPKYREMRGVWVATVENIDFPKTMNVKSFCNEYIKIVNNLKKNKFNAIFFQVRPMNDAFYPSKLNPYSRFLTGREGQSLGNFDPLKFMVEQAHRRGIEFHAWLNPYRVNSSSSLPKESYLKTLNINNFARKNPSLVLSSKLPNGKYSMFLNPGEPMVINHILNTIKEIISKYQVDAIHFDDYFYPYSSIGNIDYSTYVINNPHKMSLANWRRNNVNYLIKSIHDTINVCNRNRKRKVQFGISPFGIWGNKRQTVGGSLTGGKESLNAQFADSRKWVKNNWIDYIVPQLYWPFTHPVAAYAALADWWAYQVKGTKCNLYIGMGAYRLGEDSTWKVTELYNQQRYNSKHSLIQGVVLFSYRSVFKPNNYTMKNGVERLINSWLKPVLPPKMR